MKYLQGLFEKVLGKDVILFTTNPAVTRVMECGTIPTLFNTVDFGPGILTCGLMYACIVIQCLCSLHDHDVKHLVSSDIVRTAEDYCRDGSMQEETVFSFSRFIAILFIFVLSTFYFFQLHWLMSIILHVFLSCSVFLY